MITLRSVFALALAAMVPVTALAQSSTEPASEIAPQTRPETTGETRAEDQELPRNPAALSLGEELSDEDRVGENYIAGEFGDWQMTCVRSGREADPCQLYQMLNDQQGNSVAEIILFNLPTPQDTAVAGATIVTPLETLLPTQITMRVDSGQAKRYPFTFCAPMGCVARVGFTEAEIAGFRRGNRATMVIVPAMAPDEQVALTMSLAGFTAGYQAVVEANAAAIAAERAAGITSSGE